MKRILAFNAVIGSPTAQASLSTMSLAVALVQYLRDVPWLSKDIILLLVHGEKG